MSATESVGRWWHDRKIEWPLVAVCLLIAVYYIGSTSFAVWHYGFTELFADQFRQYARLLSEPFPGNVLLPDNSHRQLTSNLVRLADLHWGRGGQDIGVGAGLTMLLLALGLLLARILRDSTLAPLQRASGVLLASCALMWMGSARMQFHGNEAFQVYLVMACALVVLACVESLRAQPRAGVGALAVAAAGVALLTFATGVAVSALLVALLVLRRVEWRWTLALSGTALFGVFAYMFLLPGGESVRGVASTAWTEIAVHATTFLASTWTSAWLAFADAGIAGVDAASMQHARLGSPLVATARAVFWLAGAPSLHAFAFVIGMAGLTLLLWRCWRAWRRPRGLARLSALGLGLALFAAAIAVLVAVGRSALFARVPGQVFADRYLPWVNLFWLGLALDLLAAHGSRLRWRLALACGAVLASVVAYPTHRLGYGWVAATERAIERHAAEIQVGVDAEGLLVSTDMPDVETLHRAIAVLRAQRVAMFRAERNHLLGRSLADLELIPELPRAWVSDSQRVRELRTPAVPAWQVFGTLSPTAARSAMDGLVVVADDGRVVGLGEFSYHAGGSSRERIDDMANGFDVSFRAAVPCVGLRLYGVDAAARQFVALAHINGCAAVSP